ncbi:MAG: hypothetical protein Q7U20_09545 [Caulobacter sp.]|nr:hypothetical protein [Caulobacter sp.]
MEPKKTHVLVPVPEMGVRYLADYMAGSDRKRRAVILDAKYRPRARLMQHREAKATIANALINGNASKAFLSGRADTVRAKLATNDHDALTNEANADYLKRFSEVVESLDLPGVEFLPGKIYTLAKVNGLKVPFRTDLTLRRMTKTNKIIVGSMMFRYAKGKALSDLAADYQAAAIFGFMKECAVEDGAELDRSLCITLDGFTGAPHAAPTNSVTLFKNTQAACATIAEAWPNTQPPKGAVL